MSFVLRNLLKRANPGLRKFSAEVNEAYLNEKWDLFAGVSLERLPIITRSFNEEEEKFAKYLSEKELQNSHKSNFEIRIENDLKMTKQLKEGNLDDFDIDNIPKQTGQDFLDACHEELKLFKFEPRKANENTENNVKSTRRVLDRRLLLLIKDKIGEKHYWILPQGIYKGEESLLQTAERVLQEKCGSNINVKFLGNFPCGFYKYKYPKHIRNNSVGAKIFFFKAQLVTGQVDEKICNSFQWATRKELVALPKDYGKTIEKFLLDEDH